MYNALTTLSYRMTERLQFFISNIILMKRNYKHEFLFVWPGNFDIYHYITVFSVFYPFRHQ